MNRMIAFSATAALVAGSGIAMTEPVAAAKTYTACVKKSTGEVRLLLGKSKKCQKGWKKTKWTKAGPSGARGPDGPAGTANSLGVVVDGGNAVVGLSLGIFSAGPMAQFSVLIDGGAYSYLQNGWLVPQSFNTFYDNAACTGTPFIEIDQADALSAVQQDPTLRVVYRKIGPVLGPASAYKQSGAVTSVINGQDWYPDGAGTCTASAAFTGYRVFLTPVTAPPDHPGPLKVA